MGAGPAGLGLPHRGEAFSKMWMLNPRNAKRVISLLPASIPDGVRTLLLLLLQLLLRPCCCTAVV